MSEGLREHAEWMRGIGCALGSGWLVNAVEECGSTMDVAREALLAGPPERPLTVIVTERQVSGRGRQGRAWIPAKRALFCTLVWQAPAAPEKLSGWSLVAGLELHRVLAGHGASTVLKWPNDLLSLRGRKLSGILVEVFPAHGHQWVLTGIGVNLEGAPADGIACGLDEITDRRVTADGLLAEMAPRLARAWHTLMERGFAEFRDAWNSASWPYGTKMTIEAGERVVRGAFAGADDQGRLVLVNDGREEPFSVAHVIDWESRNAAGA